MKNIINGILLFSSLSIFGQGFNKVSHNTGTQVINGTSVTVGVSGKIMYTSNWCSDVGPYVPGYSSNANPPTFGAVTFSFNPAVGTVSLNFAALTDSAFSSEVIQVFKNGAHYKIPTAGTKNSCDKQAILTSEGNVRACYGCALAGWNGTVIKGPISTITVQDTIIANTPDGAFFSLYFNNIDITSISEHSEIGFSTYSLCPNPFQNNATLKFKELQNTGTFFLYDGKGQLVKTITEVGSNQLLLERDDLPAGIYFFILKDNDEIHTRGKLVME